MRAKTFYIETHGCQMNEHDSEKISGLLSHRGLLPVASLAEADLFVLNTCSVREKAVQKVYSRLGAVRVRKKMDPHFCVAVIGCVAQQEGEEMVNKAPFVDLVVGTHQLHTLPDLLDELQPSRAGAVHTEFRSEKIPVEIPQTRRNTVFRSNVTIMEGCNKRCAFCVVPFTRGPERSRPAARVLEEIREAADLGFVEIVLLGQTVNSYRDPDRPAYHFTDLLAEAATVAGIRRIRFSSPHPRNFTPETIRVIAENETICNHVHLPVQSGSSRILRRMRRQHDRDWYLRLVADFAACGRQIALSTDMIVGFPGETEQDFEDTLSLTETVRFEQMFSFKYSVRPHTEAELWPDDVPAEVKSRRLLTLQALQRDIQLQIHREHYQGREFEVLTEGTAKDGYRRFGRTTTNKIVNYEGKAPPGDFVVVRINGVGPNSLIGEKWSQGLGQKQSCQAICL